MRPMIDSLPRCRFIFFLRLRDKCSLQKQPRSQGFFAGMVCLAVHRVLVRWLVGDVQARKNDSGQ